ncbi:unnamed protein product [Tetraodon nigroviridis]|uniref:(spotted green pufferfish) hypothetical protein n=1 Tax=Tetraodon nigroviridis TaxID=99883 RepID=Q4RRQ5_TETNG|nr:unnamed protein product [Tetraodon nigroviridis]
MASTAANYRLLTTRQEVMCGGHERHSKERAVWPIDVNTAACARIKEAEGRESVHVIGLCRERRWTGVTGRAGHRGERALLCPLQPFKDNKPQPPHRVDFNNLYLYVCTHPRIILPSPICPGNFSVPLRSNLPILPSLRLYLSVTDRANIGKQTVGPSSNRIRDCGASAQSVSLPHLLQ